jgi:hypothetical protein
MRMHPTVRYTGAMSEDIGDSLGPVIELVDVVPIKQRRPVEGGRLFFTSVELWSHGVRWHGSEIPEPDDAGPNLILYKMRDDLGTAYHGTGSGGSSRRARGGGAYRGAGGDDAYRRAGSDGAYRGAGRDGSEGPLWWSFLMDFEPAVPPDAREIRLIGGRLMAGNEIVVRLAAGEPGMAT